MEMNENTYVSLANKYRPQKFEDMVGQENISKTLQNALRIYFTARAAAEKPPQRVFWRRHLTVRVMVMISQRQNRAGNAPNAAKLRKVLIWMCWS